MNKVYQAKRFVRKELIVLSIQTPLEQIATEEIALLVLRRQLPFNTMISGIEFSPLERIMEPDLPMMQRPGIVRYLRTTATLYCDNREFAEVTVEGSVEGFAETLKIYWRTTKLRAKRHPDGWVIFEPAYRLYSNAWHCGQQGEKEVFERRVSKAVNCSEC